MDVQYYCLLSAEMSCIIYATFIFENSVYIGLKQVTGMYLYVYLSTCVLWM
jgi:hypothetical protein